MSFSLDIKSTNLSSTQNFHQEGLVLTRFQKKKFTRQFHRFCANGNKVLAWDDFELLLERLRESRGWNEDSPQLAQAGKSFRAVWEAFRNHSDRNWDGAITLKEWLAFHKTALYDAQLLSTQNPAYRDLVNGMTRYVQSSLDNDGDGEITADEYDAFCRAHGIEAEEARTCFQTMDRNGDQRLTKTEVYDLILEYYCTDDPNAAGNLFFGMLN